MRLILASTSPYRRSLMDRLGMPYQAVAPDFEERGPREAPNPKAMVTENALGKARSLVPGKSMSY